MTNNSIIQLKGLQKTILVTRSEAHAISEVWKNTNISPDYVIHVGKTMFRKGDIKYIEENKDGSKSEAWEKVSAEFYAEEQRAYERLVKTSASYRSKLLDLFIGLYQFSSGSLPSSEVLQKATEIQEKFFQENPRRTVCDLHLLKELIPMNNEKPNPFQCGFFRIAENAVFRDMKLAGQLTKK